MNSVFRNTDEAKSTSNIKGIILKKRENPATGSQDGNDDGIKLTWLSRAKNVIRQYSVIVPGFIALELVMMSSFSFLDGFVLGQIALAVGTVVYVLDGVIKH